MFFIILKDCIRLMQSFFSEPITYIFEQKANNFNVKCYLLDINQF